MSKEEYQALQLEGDEWEEREFYDSTWTDSASGKRKRGNRDDPTSEHHSNKRPRSPSDFSGGIVMSSKPPDTYHEHGDLRPHHNNGSVPPPPPPPHPRHEAINFELHAGATNLYQHRSNEKESSGSRQETTAVTRTLLSEELDVTINRELSACPELNSLLAPMLEFDPARRDDQSVEVPRTGSSVQTSLVATGNPAHNYRDPIFTKPMLQHNQEARESGTGDLGHQLHEEHTNGPTTQNEADVAGGPAHKLPSPSMRDAQRGDQAHVENFPDDRQNPGAINIVSGDFRPQDGAFSTMRLLADPSRKRSIGDVENGQLPSSSCKKRRASPKSNCNDSLSFGSSKETPTAGSSKDGSVEGMEDAVSRQIRSEIWQVPVETDDNESTASSSSTETTLSAASMKRSVEDMEDVLLETSTPKRRRSSSNSASTQPPPSSPFNPPERSTPSVLLNSDKTPSENGTIGAMPDPAPLEQDAPLNENPTAVTFRPNDTEELALPSSSQTEANMDGRNLQLTNTDDQSANLEDPGATRNGGSEMKEHGTNTSVSREPESRNERYIRTKDDPDDMATDSLNPRDQRTTHLVQDCGNSTEQPAIGVFIPSQIPQRIPTANQELPINEDIANIPVIRNKHKRGRKPSNKSRKTPQSVPQRQQERLKPRTRGQKARQLKPENGQQAYVGRLRPGIGERKHKKPSKYSTSSRYPRSRPNSWVGLVALEFKGRKAVQVRAKAVLN